MKKILLIEDNLEMRENTAEILELANYRVITAENGRTGVELAREELPELILCDIMMPVLDGYAVLHILSKDSDTAGIPFVFLTAKVEKSDLRKGMNLGADDYVTKPFEDTELLDAVESRLKRAELLKGDYSNDLDGLNHFINEARSLNALEKLSEDRRTNVYKKKSMIFMEGNYPNSVFLIMNGKVKTSMTNDEGKEFITGFHEAGDYIGYMPLLEETKYAETATVLEEAEVGLIPKDDFLSLIRNNRDVSVQFIKMLANNVQEKEDRLLKLAYGSLRERVAEALLSLQKEQKGDDVATISFSRDDLAALVGTATESLIRTLSDFKEEKLIETKGREISLVDPHGLEKVSNPY